MRFFLTQLRLRTIWSWHGWCECWRNEHSLRSWVWANCVSGILALLLPLSGAERGLIFGLGFMVLAMELMNAALERAVDYISKDQHELAKQAKDAGSAAVAVAAIAAGLGWLGVLIW